jgi:hypothetical protein
MDGIECMNLGRWNQIKSDSGRTIRGEGTLDRLEGCIELDPVDDSHYVHESDSQLSRPRAGAGSRPWHRKRRVYRDTVAVPVVVVEG